ncbi:uncharacterized protein LOC122508755 isoform X2 [Leptopilina heterotoma]|nr:uncharacterized protein LOC122508755 isoform X2 [Leptopilina heterotoma]
MKVSTNEVIDAIQFWDKTVELVGFVGKVFPRIVSGNTELLKFFFCNDTGKKIQCVIWNKQDIDALERNIVENTKLHIDGACARVPIKEGYNKGNVNFELQLYSTTVVTSLGPRELEAVVADENILEVEMDDIVHHENETIKLFAYIKSKFVYQSIGGNQNLGTYGCGSVTDGNFKLEVRIASFRNTMSCEKGDPVNILGQIRSQGPRIYLQVNTENDVQVVPETERLPVRDLMFGYRELKRVCDRQNSREDPE